MYYVYEVCIKGYILITNVYQLLPQIATIFPVVTPTQWGFPLRGYFLKIVAVL